jgi:preprotein translocase subunit SecF
MRLIKEKTSIDFLSRTRRNVALALSAIILVTSIVSLFTRGLDFGIDFTGGVLLEVGYSEAANLVSIRNRLSDAGFEDYRVTRPATATSRR